MKDIIVRLASMKLAELKFKIETQYENTDRYEEKLSSLKDIPNLINDTLRRFSLESTRKVSMLSKEYTDFDTFYFSLFFYDELGELILMSIEKPDNISVELFLKLLKTIGLSKGTQKIKNNHRFARTLK